MNIPRTLGDPEAISGLSDSKTGADSGNVVSIGKIINSFEAYP